MRYLVPLTCLLGTICYEQIPKPQPVVSEARSTCPCGPNCCCPNCDCSLHQAQIPVRRHANWPPPSSIKMTQSVDVGVTLTVPADLFPLTIVVGPPITKPQLETPPAPANPIVLPPVQKPPLPTPPVVTPVPPAAGKPPVSWPPPPWVQRQLEKP